MNHNDYVCGRLEDLVRKYNSASEQGRYMLKGEIDGTHKVLLDALRRNGPAPNWSAFPNARTYFLQNHP